jgi:hypothetical protein
MKALTSLFAAFVLCFGLAAQSGAADIPPLAQPILLTSLGQAADVNTFNVLAKRAAIPMEYKTMATGADVQGKKTVILCVGVSLKGFGAAGINLETETSRANDIVAAAKAAGAYVILAHIGGEERRDNMSNRMLGVAMPLADAYIVYAQGNADGYFTKEAGSKPLVLLDKTMDLVEVLKKLGGS